MDVRYVGVLVGAMLICSAVKAEPSAAQETVQAAQAKLRLGQTREAAALLATVLDAEANANPSELAMAQAMMRQVYMHDNRLPEYVQKLQQQLTATPDSEPLLADLAQTYMMMARPDKAADTYARLLQLTPSPANVTQHLAALEQAGDADAVLAAVADAEKRYPAAADQWRPYAVRAYRQLGQWDRAIEVAQALAAKPGPAQAQHQIQCAELLLAAGRADAALAAYEAAPAATTAAEKAQRQADIARVYAAKKDYAKAAALTRSTIAADPEGQHWAALAPVLVSSLDAMGATDKVVAELEAAVAAKPTDLGPRRELAAIYMTQRKPAELAAHCGELARQTGQQNFYRRWLQALQTSRQFDALASANQEYFAKFPPQRPEDSLPLVRALAAAGKPDQALAQLKKLREAAPKDADLAAETARVLAGTKDLAGAVEAYDAAIGLGTGRQVVGWQLAAARLLIQQQAWDKATARIEAILSTTSNAGDQRQAEQLLVQVLQKTGKLDGHLAALEEKLGAEPTNIALLQQVVAVCARSQDHAKLGRYALALSKLSPSQEAYGHLISAAQYSRNLDPEAEAAIREFAVGNPMAAGLGMRLAMLYTSLGQHDKAVALLDQELAATGDQNLLSALRQQRVNALLAKGEFAAARTALEDDASMPGMPAGARHQMLLAAYQGLGQMDAYLAALAKRAAAATDDGATTALLADGLMHAGRAAEAIKAWGAAAAAAATNDLRHERLLRQAMVHLSQGQKDEAGALIAAVRNDQPSPSNSRLAERLAKQLAQ